MVENREKPGLAEVGGRFAADAEVAVDPDAAIRTAAFAALDALVARHGSTLPWSVIERGFTVGGEKVWLASRAEGIFKPRQMRTVLSVKTTIPRRGRTARYADQAQGGGFALGTAGILYDFKGSDPLDPQNQLLWDAHLRRLPLIHLFGVAPSLYEVVAPVFVEAWDGTALNVQLSTAVREMHGGAVVFPESADERRYATRQASRRLHQRVFRERVLAAYRNRCALSRLRVPELVDAAHIVPDGDVALGQPLVQNGICRSKPHHTAFDLGLLAIDAEFTVKIAPSLVTIDDGPMIEHLRAIDGRRMRLPEERALWPDRNRLARRFEQTVTGW